ncbi:putative cysteine-rich receptor-like protein kinase 9 [Telopea speciosissima]|uniref:putative cysteine-rich receptor-like protein kinase 9 n=1 Tax=Telopea speciosissima TaxID=54955 RepID=UPI001CC47F17|nr:putative cysteine-rich receptor-like protein kinase 9 [Telopea speciosissima]
MAYTALLMFLISCIILLLLSSSSISAQPVQYACSGPSGVNQTTNSTTYITNLNSLLNSLSSNATSSDIGFYNTTIGDGSDKVYGLFLCRGDITHQDCQNCVLTASEEIKPICSNMITAISWYDYCLIRYSNQSIFSILQQEPVTYRSGPSDVTNLDKYNQTVRDLMSGLVREAAYGSSTPKYYAAGQVNYSTGYNTVYGLVQCTPDITKDECNRCLSGSVSDIPKKHYPKQEGRVLKPSCTLWYQFNFAFFNQQVPSPPATPPSTNSTSHQDKRSNSTVNVTIVVIIVIAATITIIIIIVLYLRLGRKQNLKVEGTIPSFYISWICDWPIQTKRYFPDKLKFLGFEPFQLHPHPLNTNY